MTETKGYEPIEALEEEVEFYLEGLRNLGNTSDPIFAKLGEALQSVGYTLRTAIPDAAPTLAMGQGKTQVEYRRKTLLRLRDVLKERYASAMVSKGYTAMEFNPTPQPQENLLHSLEEELSRKFNELSTFEKVKVEIFFLFAYNVGVNLNKLSLLLQGRHLPVPGGKIFGGVGMGLPQEATRKALLPKVIEHIDLIRNQYKTPYEIEMETSPFAQKLTPEQPRVTPPAQTYDSSLLTSPFEAQLPEPVREGLAQKFSKKVRGWFGGSSEPTPKYTNPFE